MLLLPATGTLAVQTLALQLIQKGKNKKQKKNNTNLQIGKGRTSEASGSLGSPFEERGVCLISERFYFIRDPI